MQRGRIDWRRAVKEVSSEFGGPDNFFGMSLASIGHALSDHSVD